MKICRINAVYGIQSTGRFVKQLHDEALRLGQESFVFVAEIPKHFKNEKGVFKIGNRLDHLIHGLLSRISGLQGYFSKVSTFFLIKKIKRINPDIIHLHNLHANYINLSILLKFINRKKIPLVITLHDFWFITGKCTHFVDADCYRWKASCGNCPKLKNDNKSWFFDRTPKIIQDKRRLFHESSNLAVVSVSDWAHKYVEESLLGSACINQRIYNWVDNAYLKPPKFKKDELYIKYKLSPDKPIILFVASNWSSNKGVDDLKVFLDDINYNKFNIIIVGSSSFNWIKKGNHIWIPEIHDIYLLSSLFKASDYFINLSKMETYGRVMVEAAISGAKIAAYPLTANKEILKLFNGIEIVSLEKLLVYLNANTKPIEREPELKNIKIMTQQYGILAYFKIYQQLLKLRD